MVVVMETTSDSSLPRASCAKGKGGKTESPRVVMEVALRIKVGL